MMHLPYCLDRTANMDCTATDNKMSAMPPQNNAGATDTNCEWYLNRSMEMSVDNEGAQRRKWRR